MAHVDAQLWRGLADTDSKGKWWRVSARVCFYDSVSQVHDLNPVKAGVGAGALGRRLSGTDRRVSALA